MRKLLLTILTIGLLAAPLAVAGRASAENVDVLNPVCVDQEGNPLPEARRPALCDDGQNKNDAENFESPITGENGILTKVTNVLALVVGFACVIVIIISGIRFIVSAGDSNSISSARRSLLYAVVGLVIVVFARTLVRFILSRIN